MDIIARGRRGLLALALAGGWATAHAGEWHGYLTAGSDYVFRGVSQANEEPAAQAGLDYAHVSGFFAGLFAASIEYPASPFYPDLGNLELDAYLGFGRPAGRDVSWDVALIHYAWPGSGAENDYQELGFNLHYEDFARLGITASDDARSGGASGWTAELELRRALGGRFQVSATLGHYALARSGWRDYEYWDCGLSAVTGPVTFDLRYFGASGDAETLAGPDLARHRVVASASVGF